MKPLVPPPLIGKWADLRELEAFVHNPLLCVCVLVAQRSPTVCNPLDCIARQAPLGFPRQEHCSGLPFPFSGDLSDPGIEPGSAALQADS